MIRAHRRHVRRELGACAMSVASRLPMPPALLAGASAATWRSSTRLSAPFQRGSRVGKVHADVA